MSKFSNIVNIIKSVKDSFLAVSLKSYFDSNKRSLSMKPTLVELTIGTIGENERKKI